MQEKYIYFQPEYVSDFQCDGKACRAFCCRKDWKIVFDQRAYEKYSSIRPKEKALEITKHLARQGGGANYILQFDENKHCPMLMSDNLCMIQKNYGEDYLSNVCATYPRVTKKIGDLFERSLTLTCPIVAEKVLNQDTPIPFELVEVSEKIHSNGGRILIETPMFIPPQLLNHVVEIQFAAISILQERSLTIDQRLIALGFFLELLDDLVTKDKLGEIINLSTTFSTQKFLKENAPIFSKAVDFNAEKYVKFIFDILRIANRGEKISPIEKMCFFAWTYVQIDDAYDKIDYETIVQNYLQLNKFCKGITKCFSTVFENYLVNEFFMNCYPWKFPESIMHNYKVFLMVYKMIEFVASSLAIHNLKKGLPLLNKFDLITSISILSDNIDHSESYVGRISEYLKSRQDLNNLIKSVLQT